MNYRHCSLVTLGIIGFLLTPVRYGLHATHSIAESVAVGALRAELRLEPVPKKLRILHLTSDEIEELLNQETPIVEDSIDEGNTNGAI